jgi:two-component system NarL family response regulator
MPEAIRILVVDDHHVVRQGLVALLNIMPGIEVVGQAADGAEAIRLYRELNPDITLMDLQLPGISGVEAIRRIRQEAPSARFIVLTTFDGDEDIYRALEAGARAYLLKGMTVDELTSAIKAVHAGKTRIAPNIAEKLAERMSGQTLTAREQDVLERIAAGRSNKEIASDLEISEATVKTHINSLLGKLGVGDRTHAATVAIQRGIIHLK